MIGAMAETTSKTTSSKSSTAPSTSTLSASPSGGDHDTETIAPGDRGPAPLADSESPIPRDSDGRIIPTPGDVRTEPVATAAQSHVAGRVGPRTVPEDATSAQPAGAELSEVMPGAVLPDTPEGTGPVPVELGEDPRGEFLAGLDDGRQGRETTGQAARA